MDDGALVTRLDPILNPVFLLRHDPLYTKYGTGPTGNSHDPLKAQLIFNA